MTSVRQTARHARNANPGSIAGVTPWLFLPRIHGISPHFKLSAGDFSWAAYTHSVLLFQDTLEWKENELLVVW